MVVEPNSNSERLSQSQLRRVPDIAPRGNRAGHIKSAIYYYFMSLCMSLFSSCQEKTMLYSPFPIVIIVSTSPARTAAANHRASHTSMKASAAQRRTHTRKCYAKTLSYSPSFKKVIRATVVPVRHFRHHYAAMLLDRSQRPRSQTHAKQNSTPSSSAARQTG
jgi:hypothetical protein